MLSHKEAQNWYRNGNGLPIVVDASKINLTYINPSIFANSKTQSVSLLGYGDFVQGTVYGVLDLTYHDNGFVSIDRNTYDFDFENHPWFGGQFWRNVATALGSFNDGAGYPNAQPFDIIFSGQSYIGLPSNAYDLLITLCSEYRQEVNLAFSISSARIDLEFKVGYGAKKIMPLPYRAAFRFLILGNPKLLCFQG